MGVLSNTQIRQALNDGHIVCRPFNPKHVSHASLDVTLGYYYYRTEKTGDYSLYNPFDIADVKRYFDGPYKAVKHKDWCMAHGRKLLKGIPPNHPIIPLKPDERIL